MKISVCQYDIVWQSPADNLTKIENTLVALSSEDEKSDILVLPEMFNVGFSMDAADFAETTDGQALTRLRNLSSKFNIAICGSMPVKIDATVYNKLFFITPEGKEYSYDKKHLFSLGAERDTFTPGNKRIIVEYRGVRFFLSVCYDVRFPVWMRCRDLEYDAIINVANWPQARIDSWTTLLKARAIENQCYVIGANRVGVDGMGFAHNGQSAVYDFKGNLLTEYSSEDCLLSCVIDIDKQNKFRNKFTVWKDADSFQIQ